MRVLIVLPAYNEEQVIQSSIITLDNFLRSFLDDEYTICASDNSSTDATSEIIKAMEPVYPRLKYFFAEPQGKGNAVMKPWESFINDYDIFVFLDADMATDLRALPDLVDAIKTGSDIAIGSRYLPGSVMERSVLRQIFSRVYRRIIKSKLKSSISDFPCGFKAVSRDVVRDIVPLVRNRQWFFDSELLYVGEKKGKKIKEIPVVWKEPRKKGDKSRISLRKQSAEYLKEIRKLKKRKL